MVYSDMNNLYLQVQLNIEEEVFVFHTECHHPLHHAEYVTTVHLPRTFCSGRKSHTLYNRVTFLHCVPHDDFRIDASDV